jgi:hypothetical protein
MPAYPPAEESRDRLHRAGWSVGDVGTAGGSWLATRVSPSQTAGSGIAPVPAP